MGRRGGNGIRIALPGAHGSRCRLAVDGKAAQLSLWASRQIAWEHVASAPPARLPVSTCRFSSAIRWRCRAVSPSGRVTARPSANARRHVRPIPAPCCVTDCPSRPCSRPADQPRPPRSCALGCRARPNRRLTEVQAQSAGAIPPSNSTARHDSRPFTPKSSGSATTGLRLPEKLTELFHELCGPVYSEACSFASGFKSPSG